MKDRVILHCDCNAFFASVETLLDPTLRDVPMAVTGDPEQRHGIILAKNERAKAFGVKTAETIREAKAKCPALVCVLPHYDEYHRVSREINRIYLDYTDLVDPFGIDESFLDVTGSLRLFGFSPREFADTIRERVKREIGVTISVGVSFCRVFAKLGSDYKKPDATTVFDREHYKELVYPLPVSDLLYAGKKTTEALSRLGIKTIGQLAQADEKLLGSYLGEAGLRLLSYARGEDDSPVRSFFDREKPKSVGNGMTFRRDLFGENEIRAGLMALCDEVSARLRDEEMKCLVIQVQIKDPNLRTIQRQSTLPRATWLCQEIFETALSLVRASYGVSRPIRSLTVTASSLVPKDEVHEQLSFFEESAQGEKQERLEGAIGSIRQKFGKGSIHLGAYENAELGIGAYGRHPPPPKKNPKKVRDPKKDSVKK